VLNIFGFTSQQTVASFTEKILDGATADAVQLLHEQSEAGKDMMKLMSDLIAYLRDLLVFKVKPDALSEDVDFDEQKALAAQAQLIETDRLLELIDQFGEAEGRMKWAPNKKLHFEVALIKAIQTLSQVTLNEVIENLNALRDGKSEPKKAVAGVVDAGDASAARTGIADHGYKAEKKTARVAEQASQYMAPGSADVDPAQVWKELSTKIPPQKGFLRNSVGAAHVIGIEGRNFLLGFSPHEKSMMEIMGTQANRKFLETLLHEITRKDLSVKLSVQEDLAARNPRPQANESGKPPTKDFKDDPLIKEALEMFKGEIKA
jgi:DNA polymerase III subunit gamma/tau